MYDFQALIIAFSLGLLTVPFLEYIAIPYLFPALWEAMKERRKQNKKTAKKKSKKKKKGNNKKRVVKRTTVTEEYEEK